MDINIWMTVPPSTLLTPTEAVASALSTPLTFLSQYCDFFIQSLQYGEQSMLLPTHLKLVHNFVKSSTGTDKSFLQSFTTFSVVSNNINYHRATLFLFSIGFAIISIEVFECLGFTPLNASP